MFRYVRRKECENGFPLKRILPSIPWFFQLTGSSLATTAPQFPSTTSAMGTRTAPTTRTSPTTFVTGRKVGYVNL